MHHHTNIENKYRNLFITVVHRALANPTGVFWKFENASCVCLTFWQKNCYNLAASFATGPFQLNVFSLHSNKFWTTVLLKYWHKRYLCHLPSWPFTTNPLSLNYFKISVYRRHVKHKPLKAFLNFSPLLKPDTHHFSVNFQKVVYWCSLLSRAKPSTSFIWRFLHKFWLNSKNWNRQKSVSWPSKLKLFFRYKLRKANIKDVNTVKAVNVKLYRLLDLFARLSEVKSLFVSYNSSLYN